MNKQNPTDSLGRTSNEYHSTNTNYVSDGRLPQVIDSFIDADFRQPAAIPQRIPTSFTYTTSNVHTHYNQTMPHQINLPLSGGTGLNYYTNYGDHQNLQQQPVFGTYSSVKTLESSRSEQNIDEHDNISKYNNLDYPSSSSGTTNTSSYCVPSYSVPLVNERSFSDTPRPVAASTNTNSSSASEVGVASFSNSGSACSFSEIARKNAEANSGVDPAKRIQMDNTLNEYGPVYGEAPEESQTSTDHSNQPSTSTSMTHSDGANSYIHQYSSSTTYSPATISEQKSEQPDIGLKYTTENLDEQKKDENCDSVVSSHVPPTLDQSSPPLDSIANPAVTTIDNNNQAPANQSKIPKLAPSSDPLDLFDVNELTKKYRDVEADVKENLKRMQDIEKFLNDMQRRSHGKNIELDPEFRQKKGDQKQCSRLSQELNADLKRIKAKLFDRYQVNINPQAQPKPHPQRQRAKMSTGSSTPTPRRDVVDLLKKDSQYSNLLLKFQDTKTWCELCDIHFDDLIGFCEHLHAREHQKRMKNIEPWRVTKEMVSKKKTTDLIGSMCSKIESELSKTLPQIKFNIQTLTSALIPPDRESKEKYLSNLFINRTKGQFADDDPLLMVKGYNYLVPVRGYYCTLCSCSLCDYKSADEHLKSYEHSLAHAKSVALDPLRETSFLQKLEKSYRTQHKGSKGSHSITTGSKNGDRLPLQQYKKATSRIVDEHETVKSKFPQRITSAKQPTGYWSKNTETSSVEQNSTRKRPLIEVDSDEEASKSVPSQKTTQVQKTRREIHLPEIVPIGARSQPAALKRLRVEQNQGHQAISKTSSSIEQAPPQPSAEAPVEEPISPDEVTYIEAEAANQTPWDDDGCLLQPGDSDSPFPDLTIRLSGNAHLDTLKDKRLAAPCKVVLKEINIEDYKDILLDSATLWSRMFQLLAKKESTNSKHQRMKTKTHPFFFGADGNEIPIDIKGNNNVKKEQPSEETSKNSNDLFDVGETSKPDLDMTFLNEFFCEK